jgi:hypothetical protein
VTDDEAPLLAVLLDLLTTHGPMLTGPHVADHHPFVVTRTGNRACTRIQFVPSLTTGWSAGRWRETSRLQPVGTPGRGIAGACVT